MQKSKNKLHSKLIGYLPVVFVGILLVVIGVFADRQSARNQERDLRKSVYDQISVIRAQLEGNISSNAQLVQGLVAAINAEPNMSQQRYAMLAKPLLDGHSHLRNIAAAPDYVIRYMYPIKGNEAAIGLNFRAKADQFEAVRRAEITGRLVLAGPVNLVQGGQGFIARIPIFLGGSSEDGKDFWGIVSAVIDVESLYRESGLLDKNSNIELAIRGKNATGAQGEAFMGRNSLFDENPELVNVMLPYGSWQMGGIPKMGWSRALPSRAMFRATYFVTALVVLLLILMWNRALAKHQEIEAQFQQLFEVAPLPLAFVNKELQIQITNKRFEETFGYSPSEIPTVNEWWPLAYPDPDYRNTAIQTWNSAIEVAAKNDTDIEPIEYQVTCKNGQVRSMIISGRLIGENLLATFFDVTEQRKQANIIRAERDRAQRYLDTVQVLIVSLDKNGHVTMINRKGCDMIGYSETELLGKNWFQYCLPSPEGMEVVYPIFKQIVAGQIESLREFENEILCKDGRKLLIAWQNAYFHDEAGNIAGVLSSGEDITERKVTEKKLISARDEAEKANQAKSEFLSRMSHELRTPMNAILGFSQLLELENLNATQLENIGEIRKAGTHLLDLINEVLDLAKIEAGRMEMSIESVELAVLVRDCTQLLASLLSRHQITLNFNEKQFSHVYVRADVMRLRQALLNLLSNAIKYNHSGGSVSVNCSVVDKNYVRIDVIDTGPGISNEKQSSLFIAFNRLGAEVTEIEGTGIGLVITRNLVTLMHGDIGVESEPGRGSRFWITLPLDQNKSAMLRSVS